MAEVQSDTKTASAMPQERPASLGELTIVGQMVPIERLPPYMRGDTEDGVEKIINNLVAGEMVPKSFMKKNTNEANVPAMRIAIMNGRYLGYNPLYSIQNQAVINGIPRFFGDAPLARVYASGLMADFEETMDEGDPQNPIAICRVVRKGMKTPTVRTFSYADAQQAGLSDKEGPWQAYWRRMLQFRARSFTLRDAFADILQGMPIAEEIMDRSQFAKWVNGEEIDNNEAVPPRPSRPAPAATGKPDLQVVPTVPESYQLIDKFGSDAGWLTSGDWLDRVADMIEKEPGDRDILIEANAETIDALRGVLGAAHVDKLLAAPAPKATPQPDKPKATRGKGAKPGATAPADQAAQPAKTDPPAAPAPAPNYPYLCDLLNEDGEILATAKSDPQLVKALQSLGAAIRKREADNERQSIVALFEANRPLIAAGYAAKVMPEGLGAELAQAEERARTWPKSEAPIEQGEENAGADDGQAADEGEVGGDPPAEDPPEPENVPMPFEVKNETGKILYRGAPGKYGPYVDALMARMPKLAQGDKTRLRDNNLEWLKTADAEGFITDEQRRKLLLPVT